jgi:ubiquinone biosynthesis protein UbiJ
LTETPVKLPLPITLIIEKAINTFIEQSPKMRQQFSTYAGKLIKIELTDFNLAIFFYFSNNSIKVMSEYESEPDTTFIGSSVALSQLIQQDMTDTLFTGNVVIQGDMHLGEDLKNSFSQYPIDFEEKLSTILGDVFTHQLFAFFNRTKKWTNASEQIIQSNISEYLVFERERFACQHEISSYTSSVDQLRLQLDRLEAKIERLEICKK